MPFSYGLEFLFWASFTLPTLATTIGWMFLADPDRGMINALLRPVLGDFKFNIYSIEGIIWAHLMSHAISGKVMLLTPAFRNMDSSMEEASRVAGGSNFKTALSRKRATAGPESASSVSLRPLKTRSRKCSLAEFPTVSLLG
jgi:iron(III) transport system permease protein